MTGTTHLKMWLTICSLMLVVVSAEAADTHSVNPGDSIQAAINAADSGDQIEVAPGIYTEAINFNGKAIKLYSTGGASVTTINGNGAYHVVQCISGEGSATVLEGFTITGGNANGSEPDNLGGGMYNTGSSPTVTNCIFTSNIAYRGGGMLNLASSSPTVTNCTFSSNTARDGGGMCNHNGSNPNVTDCTFSKNSGFDGGGMCNLGSNPTVTDCIFLSNAAYQHGGGICNGAGNPDVTNCIFSGNTAGAGGGGMMNNDRSSPKVANCIFTSVNKAGAGGGMANSVNSNPIVTNCTFTSNESTNGGGMSNYHSNPTVINCILWGNSPPQIYNYSYEVPVVTYSDVQLGTDEPWFGTGCIDAIPMFADADGRLLAGSPCIDTGSNSAVSVMTDLDGNPRIQGLCVDMGAFEVAADPEIMLANLRAYIVEQVALGIDAEMEVSLLAKVDAAIAALNRGNPNDAKVAMNDLKALVNQVEAQAGNKITAVAAAEIIVRANAIIAALGG